MEKSQDDIIYILRSNHFVQEYLEQKQINYELKNNPRFQSIIWYISIILKRQGIDFTGKSAKDWIDSNIRIGNQGEIMYILSAKDGYYPFDSKPAIQFVKYFVNENGLKRSVMEKNEHGATTLQILSNYNQDGIEESQIVEDFERNYCCVIERVKNHPELRKMIEYDKEEKMVKNTNYETRFFWPGLEDLNPNLMEVDPFEKNPLLKFGHTPFYEMLSITNINQLPALSESKRVEILQYYKTINKNFHRTTVFEPGLAKLLCVRNKEIV